MQNNNNIYIQSAEDLVTTSESRRRGFLEYALRKNKESVPYIDKAKALKVTLHRRTSSPHEILGLLDLRESLLDASGISTKAKRYLNDQDKLKILESFIEEVLIPCGDQYVEELIYRYLLFSGDALGGKMRNIVGLIANEKFTRFVISQLQISSIPFSYRLKQSTTDIKGENYKLEDVERINLIHWQREMGCNRTLAYNIQVPQVRKNIDIVLLKSLDSLTQNNTVKDLLYDVNNYVAMGELKGGIDPAGADEHWKTAHTALVRIQESFDSHLPLVFIGAAIELSMSEEIFAQYQSGKLSNCANLTVDDQLASLCDWLIRQ